FDLLPFGGFHRRRLLAESDHRDDAPRYGGLIRTRRHTQPEHRDRRARRSVPALGRRDDRSDEHDPVLPGAQPISSVDSRSPTWSSRSGRGRRGGSAFLWIWRTERKRSTWSFSLS